MTDFQVVCFSAPGSKVCYLAASKRRVSTHSSLCASSLRSLSQGASAIRIELLAAILLSACATSTESPRATDVIRDSAAAIEIGKACDMSKGSVSGKWSARLHYGKWHVRFDTPDCGENCPTYSGDVDAATGVLGPCEFRVNTD